MIYSGRVIEFLAAGKLKLGVITGQGKNRLRVVDQNGRHHSVPQNAVVVVHGDSDNTLPFSESSTLLEARIVELCREIDTELIWDSVSNRNGSVSLEELSTLYFGKAGPVEMSAIFRAILEDQIRFKVRGSSILPRSPEQVEQQLRTIKRRDEKEQLRQRSIQWLREVVRSGESVSIPKDMEDLVRRIEDFLQRREGSQIQAWLSEVTSRQTPAEVAIEVLALTGRLKEDAHHLLILAGIEEQFPQEVSKECARLQPFSFGDSRLDYRDRLAFTIDDEDTRELDDALTVETLGSKTNVGIHIAEVAHFVHKDDLLDKEALKRSTTVYLPDRTVPMFPPRLSCDLASLKASAVRPVISFLVSFGEDGTVEDWKIAESQISVDRRLTYEEADTLIAEAADDELAGPLQKLSELASLTALGRRQNGALTIIRPELKIQVENGDIDIKVLDTTSPSRRLVSEMMILANNLAARFATDQKVPIIFRAQNPPSSEITAPEDYDPVTLDSIFQKLEPSRLSIYPQPHSALGLSAYTQLTSPIRRFTDLVIQRQFTAHLAGRDLPYELQELMQILASVQASEGNVRALERRARRLFVLKQIATSQDAPLTALVIKKLSGGHLVETTDLFTRGQLVSEESLEPGQVVDVKVRKVEPEKGVLTFSLA